MLNFDDPGLEVLSAINPAPLHNPDGTPMMDATGKQISLPYQRASNVLYEEAARIGLIDTAGVDPTVSKQSQAVIAAQVAKLTTADCISGFAKAGVRLPVWKPIDMIVYCEDHAMLAVRSNFTANGRGLALHTAAGNKQIKDGIADTDENRARTQLREEQGIEAGDLVKLPDVFSRPLQVYFHNELTQDGGEFVPRGNNLPGIVPTIVSTFAEKSPLSIEEYTKRAVVNAESVALIAVTQSQLEHFASQHYSAERKRRQNPNNVVPEAGLPVSLFPSEAPFAAPLFAHANLAKPQLATVREKLEDMPAMSPEDKKIKASLGPEIESWLRPSDLMHNGSHETIAKTLVGFKQVLGRELSPDAERYVADFASPGTLLTMTATPQQTVTAKKSMGLGA